MRNGFDGMEYTNGNMSNKDQKMVRKLIQALYDAVLNTIPKYGLTRDQIPFLRPTNYWAVLVPNGLYWVVESTPVIGMPTHIFTDTRETKPPVQPNDAIQLSIKDLGFKQPLGIVLPSQVLSEDKNIADSAINSMAEKICSDLAAASQIKPMIIPQGFQHLERFAPAFIRDHPDHNKNVFLMMRFKEGEHYDTIAKVVREELAKYGLSVLRADDKDYTGDMWDDVCLYMIGCKYGIAVFEEIDERQFNPSVALELGFMMAHGKRCLLLKDSRMPKMPTDIVGKLYKPFDILKIEQSVSKAVASWAKDLGLKEKK